MPSPLASDTKTRLSRDAPTCSCLTLWTPTVGLYGGRINTGEADKRGKEAMKKEDVEQEEEGCKSKHCEQRRH